MEEKILKELEKLNKKITSIDNKFEQRFDKLETEVKLNRTQIKENTQILQALMHSSEVNKAEHDNMMIGMARIEGNVESIKKNLLIVEAATANNCADLAKIKAVK